MLETKLDLQVSVLTYGQVELRRQQIDKWGYTWSQINILAFWVLTHYFFMKGVT